VVPSKKKKKKKKKKGEKALLITFNVPDGCSNVKNIDHLSGFEQILKLPLSPAYASVDS
jgi:hypothetical protein